MKSLIMNTKKSYYVNRLHASKENSSATWSLIKELVPNKKCGSGTRHFGNVSEKAEEFNNFFANVGKTTYDLTQQVLQSSHLSSPNFFLTECSRPGETFLSKPVDTNTIILTIKSLNETHSVGLDSIAMKFINDALCIVAFDLTCIINTSIVTGVFPQAWKHANVILLFKTGDISNVSNYRPISLLPVLSKILEKNCIQSTFMLFRRK